MAKKISGEYFVDNRNFCPIGTKVRDLIEGKVEDARRDVAKKRIILEANQRKNRERIFKPLGVDMPLPEMTEQEYLDKCIPMDAWLYVQYGAILFPQPDGTVKISVDGQECLTDREARGKTLAEINGAASPKKDTPEELIKDIQWGPAGRKESDAEKDEKPAEAEKNEDGPKGAAIVSPRHEVPAEDLLEPVRAQAMLRKRKKRRIKTLKFAVIGSVALLFLLTASLLAWRFLM